MSLDLDGDGRVDVACISERSTHGRQIDIYLADGTSLKNDKLLGTREYWGLANDGEAFIRGKDNGVLEIIIARHTIRFLWRKKKLKLARLERQEISYTDEEIVNRMIPLKVPNKNFNELTADDVVGATPANLGL